MCVCMYVCVCVYVWYVCVCVYVCMYVCALRLFDYNAMVYY
jgi:hypothetical protein